MTNKLIIILFLIRPHRGVSKINLLKLYNNQNHDLTGKDVKNIKKKKHGWSLFFGHSSQICFSKNAIFEMEKSLIKKINITEK